MEILTERIKSCKLQPDASFLQDLESLCKKENVVFIDAEALCCCGELMHTGIGPLGPDYACCSRCGKILANIASPRINGGIIPDDTFFQQHGKCTWVRTGPHGSNIAGT